MIFNNSGHNNSVALAPSSTLAQRHWNKTPLYLEESERYSAYPWLYEAAEFRNHSGERVLEIGCGTGCDLLQFAKHGALAVGIDITPEHIRLARERVGNLAQVLYGDGTNIPFQDASFRILRPGGQFNMHVYALWSYWPALLMLKHGWNWKLWIENSRDPVHIDLYNARKLRRLFAPARISLEKFEFKYMRQLECWLGWFLVAKGGKAAA
jgi:SAM-dependent methyltransferase